MAETPPTSTPTRPNVEQPAATPRRRFRWVLLGFAVLTFAAWLLIRIYAPQYVFWVLIAAVGIFGAMLQAMAFHPAFLAKISVVFSRLLSPFFGEHYFSNGFTIERIEKLPDDIPADKAAEFDRRAREWLEAGFTMQDLYQIKGFQINDKGAPLQTTIVACFTDTTGLRAGLSMYVGFGRTRTIQFTTELETLLRDGSRRVTFASQALMLGSHLLPELHRQELPHRSTAQDLLAHHRARIADIAPHLIDEPPDDCIEDAGEQIDLILQRYQDAGEITPPDELGRMKFTKKGEAALANQIAETFKLQMKQSRKAKGHA